VGIFRRRKDNDTASLPTELVDGAETGADASLTAAPADGGEAAVADRSAGPFDVSEVSGPEGRLDLGALWITGTDGMELRLEIDQEEQRVIAATAVVGDSAMQLQAFAAPRSSGLWADIRSEIAAAIREQGGTAEDENGTFGVELRTRMPSAGPDGRTVFAPARFLGVDGPRWFLRGVLSGRAAIDDAAAQPLLGVFRETVVVRGGEPMGPRELLPLQLPEDAAQEGAAPAESAPDLNPFERGPEITEVR
jgi:hypothetical protein